MDFPSLSRSSVRAYSHVDSQTSTNISIARGAALRKTSFAKPTAEYQAVLDEVPYHQEAIQALADIYTRLNEPAIAAQYYGASSTA